jgi:hypothetical protein
VRVSRVTTVSGLRNAYTRRLLSNLDGLDPMAVFSSTPRRLAGLLRSAPAGALRKRWGPGKWPAAWVVHHLCDAEIGLAFRIRQVVAESPAQFVAYDQDRWAAGLHYAKRRVEESRELFTSLRRSHVAIVKMAGERDRRKYGNHPERGKETLERLVHLMAGHDVNHLRQIERATKAAKSRGKRSGR